MSLLVPTASSSQVAFQYQFYFPFSVAIHTDAAGVSVIVSERGKHRIHKYRPDGTLVWRVGNVTGSLSGGAGNDEFKYPAGVAADSTGHIYVADTGNARIQKLAPTGASVGRWGSLGTGPGHFRKPIAVTVDNRDFVYVLDGEARRVQKFSNDGATNLGSWGGALGSGDGEFSPIGDGPGDIVMDNAGNAYISDTSNHRIHKWRVTTDASGNITGTTFLGWLGRCVSGANCDVTTQRSRGFQCTAATCSASSFGTEVGQFANPRGLTIDLSDNLFVADVDNNRIQKFDSNGTLMTAFGSTGAGFAEFRGPIDVTAEGSAAVWVADSRNGRIVKFTNTGNQQSVLGGGIALTAAPGWPPMNLDSLLDPNPFFIFAGEAQTAKVTVFSLGFFSGQVTFSSNCGPPPPPPPSVGTGCVDLLTGLPSAPAGATVALSPNPVSVANNYSEDTVFTVTASSTATPGKYIRPIKAQNQPLDVRQELFIGFEILPAVPADSTVVPCPSFYQRGSSPEILPLAVLKTLYDTKRRTPSRSGTIFIGARALATKGVGWQFNLDKPVGVNPPLKATESLIVFSNPSRGIKGVYAINSASCSLVPSAGLVLDAGMTGQFRISTSDTTTLVLSRPYQDIAVLSEPPFWMLFGGRKVTIGWVGN